ncbi:hypothetical protein [Rhizobium mongolense]|uniref:Uncharacterized protein n=1 Tax=Rhizobium mongolense TaxID=57676 RepID=A0A7W6WFM1_9HYPH|nr:hypothetical protein [Rhizobium mongolense]MBB4276381.1 hypothetical protein [Rhizobium mongolense]
MSIAVLRQRFENACGHYNMFGSFTPIRRGDIFAQFLDRLVNGDT